MADQGLMPRSCDWCPRVCGANRARGMRGVCGADDQVVVARAALHLWEEPPISGTSGSGTVFFGHCPLHCVYCQNAIIAQGSVGTSLGVSELADQFLKLQNEGALNINMVTPTHYAPVIHAAIRCARTRGLTLPIVWNTSGYETVEAIRANRGFVDVYLTDFKYANASLAQAYSHAADYPEVALAALRAMVQEVGEPVFDTYQGQERLVAGVVVRHMLLPGCVNDSKQVLRMVYEACGNKVLYSLMNQYTPVLASARERGDVRAQRILHTHPELARRVTEEEYEDVLNYADELGIEDYFWQDGPTALESFIPEFGEL